MAILNTKIMAAINTYQVIVTVRGSRTVVNVFANNSSEAAINASRQLNPSNPSSVGIVSVSSINVCSVGSNIVPTRSSINLDNFGARNINTY